MCAITSELQSSDGLPKCCTNAAAPQLSWTSSGTAKGGEKKKRNREIGTAREKSPAGEVGGDADVGAGHPGGGNQVHAPRRRRLRLRGPRRRIPRHRGGGSLATFGREGAGDFRGSEGRREAHRLTSPAGRSPRSHPWTKLRIEA